jgi:hypothetical protein
MYFIVDLGEDGSRLSTGNAPQMMAALRNLVLTLIHRFGSSQVAASRRSFTETTLQDWFS